MVQQDPPAGMVPVVIPPPLQASVIQRDPNGDPVRLVTRYPSTLAAYRFTVTASAPPIFRKITIPSPCVIVPYKSSFPAASPANQLEITYLPGSGIAPGNGNHGIVSSRGACHLWAAGDWYIALGPNGPNGEQIEFTSIPIDNNPQIVEMFMRPWECGGTRGAVREATVTLAAATITTLLELDPVIFRDFIRVTNVGANAALIDWVAQTATSGMLLNAGASLEFYGKTLPMARLQGRSTVGTSIQVDTSQRHFNT